MWSDYPCIRGTNIRRWYQHHYGKLPDDILVCHHCDNTNCKQIEHIFLGTSSDNARDSVAKGRHSSVNIETRKKMAESRKGISRGPLSIETRKAISLAHRGIPRSEETKKKISESNKIRKRNDTGTD